MTKTTTAANKAAVRTDADELPVDEVHALLSNTRRRAVLDVVMDRGVVEKSDLIDAVAAAECDVPADQLGHQQRKRVHVSLHQCHLPKLEAAGVVVSEGRELSIGPNGHRVQGFRHDTRSGALGKLKGFFR